MSITGLMAAPLSDGRLQIWASKTGGVLQTLWKETTDPDSAWTPWQVMPASSLGVSVGCAAPLPNGALQLFVIANAGFNPPYQTGPGVLTTWKVGSESTAGWADWNTFYTGESAVGGGAGARSLAAAPLTDGRIQVFVVVLGNNASRFLSAWKVSPDVSSAWTDLTDFNLPTSKPITRITTARLSDGRIQLFATTFDEVITTWKVDGSSTAAWAPWQNFYPMNDDDKIIAATLSDGRPQLWRLNRNGAMWSRWKENTNANSGWTEWAVFPTPPTDKIVEMAAGSLNDGRVQLFAADSTGAMFSLWKAGKDASSAWTPWTPFPRP